MKRPGTRTRGRDLAGDDRGVSVPVDYVLLVGIVALLSLTLFTGVSSFVSGQQQQAVHTGLEVTGNRLANDVATVDRLAGRVADEGGAVRLRVPLPETVAGQAYWVKIRATGSTGQYTTYDVVVTSMGGGASVAVPVQTKRTLPTDRTFASGDLIVSYDASTAPTALEVTDD